MWGKLVLSYGQTWWASYQAKLRVPRLQAEQGWAVEWPTSLVPHWKVWREADAGERWNKVESAVSW